MKIAIVGVTGLVGMKLLELLESTKLRITDLKIFASEKSEGKFLTYKDKDIAVEKLEESKLIGFDLVFFTASNQVAQEYIPKILGYNRYIIDNSSVFRMKDGIPLIVPEINFTKNSSLIANPNCSTIQLVYPLKVLDEINKVRSINVATYQAVSGAGLYALDVFVTNEYNIHFPIKNNAIPVIDEMQNNGYTREEMKVVNEVQKILGREIDISVTCVRVPVQNSHSEAVTIEFENAVDIEKIKSALNKAKGIVLIDSNEKYPLAHDVSGKTDIYIGRLRVDLFNKRKLLLWIVADNLLRGAAYNALLIAEKLFENSDNYDCD